MLEDWRKNLGTGLRFSLMLVALLTVAMLGVACSGDEKDTSQSTEVAPVDVQPKRGGTLRVAVFSDHSTFDPTKALATPDILVIRQAYDNLILLDPDDLSLIPMLAQSWESNDDLTQFTFYLRPNVKFNHGKGLAADDVVYSFERLLDPDVWSRIAAGLDSVTKVVALDERTVRFYLDSPNLYLPDLTTVFHARIIPTDIDPERLVNEVFGTGPFILKEHVVGERIVMVRNPDYWWEGYPYLDEVIFFYIPKDTLNKSEHSSIENSTVFGEIIDGPANICGLGIREQEAQDPPGDIPGAHGCSDPVGTDGRAHPSVLSQGGPRQSTI